MSSLSGRRAVVGASWFLVAVLIALLPIAGLALVAAAFWYGALLSPTEADTGAIQNLSFGELTRVAQGSLVVFTIAVVVGAIFAAIREAGRDA